VKACSLTSQQTHNYIQNQVNNPYPELRIGVKFYRELIFALFWKYEFTTAFGLLTFNSEYDAFAD
jgi:hypothetical protein